MLHNCCVKDTILKTGLFEKKKTFKKVFGRKTSGHSSPTNSNRESWRESHGYDSHREREKAVQGNKTRDKRKGITEDTEAERGMYN